MRDERLSVKIRVWCELRTVLLPTLIKLMYRDELHAAHIEWQGLKSLINLDVHTQKYSIARGQFAPMMQGEVRDAESTAATGCRPLSLAH